MLATQNSPAEQLCPIVFPVKLQREQRFSVSSISSTKVESSTIGLPGDDSGRDLEFRISAYNCTFLTVSSSQLNLFDPKIRVTIGFELQFSRRPNGGKLLNPKKLTFCALIPLFEVSNRNDHYLRRLAL